MTGPTPSRPTGGGGLRGAPVVLKLPGVGELWGPTGSAQLDRLELPEAYALRMDSLRQLLAHYDREHPPRHHIHHRIRTIRVSRACASARGGQGHRRHLRGRDRRGHRFDSAPRSSAAGPGSPPSTASPTRSSTAGRSPSRARPSSGEPPSRPWATTGPRATRTPAPTTSGIAERRGKYKARVAVARKLLTLVFYTMRNGEVRCLDTPAAA